MKKHLSILLILAIAFGAICSLTACDPTAGLDEVSFEEILKSNFYDSYNVSTKTITYDSDGNKSGETNSSTTLSKLLAKASITADKAAVESAKAISESAKGRVCANKDYSTIVTYIYTVDSNGHITSKIIKTYTKK